jgi:YidC/Oxa1 family membrane protein insertase
MLDPIAGPLLKGLGSLLALLYELLRSYGLAIIFLTVLVRVVLLPLTIRQTRSMQEMQKLNPKVKELQRKYKGNRQKLAEETQKLYREHQVNPLGGCLPLLLQLPVFFALFGVLRATEGAYAIPAEPVRPSEVTVEGTICRPDTPPTVAGSSATEVVCRDPSGEQVTYAVEEWRAKNNREPIADPPAALSACRPDVQDDRVAGFICESVLGPGHLPEDSDLFAAIVEDRAQFLGIELACSPTQAMNEVAVRLCAGPGAQAGVVPALPYFVLVALMVGSTWYQQRQMQRAAAGQAAQQAQLMARIMPIFLGVISISISAGVLVYWVTTNAWQVGQQYLMLRSRVPETPPARAAGNKQPGGGKGGAGKGSSDQPRSAQGDGSKTKGSGHAGSRKKRRKR